MSCDNHGSEHSVRRRVVGQVLFSEGAAADGELRLLPCYVNASVDARDVLLTKLYNLQVFKCVLS